MALVFLETFFFLAVVAHGPQRIDARVHGTKILGVLSNADVARVLEVNYEALSWLDAADVCQQGEGQLAVLKSMEDLAFVNSRLFYSGYMEPTPSDRPVYVPSFFWIGLKKYPDNEWRYSDGSSGRQSTRLFGDPLATNQRDYECGGVKTDPKSALIRQRGNCMEKMPFICAYEGKPCIPQLPGSESYDYFSEEQTGFDCKSQHLSQLQMVPNNCSCIENDALRFDAVREHLSCTSKVKWSSAYCVSGCAPPPVPTSAVLVDPEPQAFTDGSMITFFCAGYFQISRTVIPTNVHQIQCKSNVSLLDEIQKIKCNPTDSLHINTNIKHLFVEAGENYNLHCEFIGFREVDSPYSIIWIKDSEVLDIPTTEQGEGKASAPGGAYYKTSVSNGGHLQIHNLSPESQGTYACFGWYRNALLPGNVFKLSTDKSEFSLAPRACPVVHLLLTCILLLRIVLL